MAEHAAEQLAERRRQFMDAYTDVDLPEADQRALLAMLAAPGRCLDPGRGRGAALVAHAGASAAAALAARRHRRDAREGLRPPLAPHRRTPTGTEAPGPGRTCRCGPSRDTPEATHSDHRGGGGL